jgi:hypothetical protein
MLHAKQHLAVTPGRHGNPLIVSSKCGLLVGTGNATGNSQGSTALGWPLKSPINSMNSCFERNGTYVDTSPLTVSYSWRRLFRSSDLRTNFRNQSGNWLQSHHRTATRSPRPSRAFCASGVANTSRSTRRERQAKKTPRQRRVRNSRTRHATDTLGCGVERSWLPHWEQTSATRGFGWCLGQSFTS